MLSPTSLTTRRQFLGRSALGAGSLLMSLGFLQGCTDHFVDPTNPNPGSPGDDSIVNPGKSVDYYAYLGNANFSVHFKKPTDLGKHTEDNIWNSQSKPIGQMLNDTLKISRLDIGVNSLTGRFEWHLFNGGLEPANGYAEINPITGNLGDSDMKYMLNTPSSTSGDHSISYGFYDSGPGFGNLTNHDQSYVYVTANQSKWMGNLANSNPSIKNAPLNRFVLPGAHDAGMFDISSVQTLANTATFKKFLALTAGLGVDILEKLDLAQINRVIINLAFTQKDSIATMLDLGIRYFDFRPGYNLGDASHFGKLYHQHNFIPGYDYDSFIGDICQWLRDNPSEIVVVALGHSGFQETYMQASPQVLWPIIDSHSTANNIVIGSQPDLAEAYTDLIQANKRLIVLGQYGFKTSSTVYNDPLQNIPIWDAAKYDSYNDGYQTTDVNVILTALNGMDPSNQLKYDYTVLQLQGTASGASGGIFDSVTTQSDASSPLMSTKASFDNATYPWIQANVPRFSADQLLVCLNDFADNALAQYCAALTKQRAG